MFSSWVGIDVCKARLDIAVLEASGVSVFSVPNSELGYKKLIEKLGNPKDLAAEIHFCFEATGKYSRGIFDFLAGKELSFSEVNPAQINSYRNSLNLRAKTDPMDAKLIAKFAKTQSPRLSKPSIQEGRDTLRRFSRLRSELSRKRASLKGELEAYDELEMRSVLHRIMETYSSEITALSTKIEELIAAHPTLKSNVALLKSIPGISDRTAHIILSEVLDEKAPDQKQPYTRKRQVAHAGLAPRISQSGGFSAKPRICKMGNDRLRSALYMPTMSSVRYNPLVRVFYLRLCESKPKKVALIAAMRKLLCISIGVLNSKTPFSADWISLPPQHS